MTGTSDPLAPPRIVAGATGYGVWPENSLEGARGCLGVPVDGVEIDVQSTADGVAVAHHDFRIAPTNLWFDGAPASRASPPIHTLTASELSRFEIAAEDGPDAAPRRTAAPTLDAVLGVLAQSDRPLWIYAELKTDPQSPGRGPDPARLVDAVLESLSRTGFLPRTKIIAFDWGALRRVRDRAPDLAMAHLVIPPALAGQVVRDSDGRSPWADGFDPEAFSGSVFQAIRAHGGAEWSPYWSEVTPDTAAAARDAGLQVGPWGLKRRADMRRMAELGAQSLTISGPDWTL